MQVRQLARLAVRAGEEDPQQVQHDRDEEDVGGPVVRLADQQARLHVERDVERRAVRLGHLRPLQRRVRAVVDGRRGARLEEERQVDAGRDEDDEAVERDLAEQERPVVGEDVAQRACGRAARRRCARRGTRTAARITRRLRLRTPHHDGPTGPLKLPAARRSPASSSVERQLRQRPPGRAEEDRAAGGRVERRVVAGADERRLRLGRREGRLAVERDRAAGVRADLRVRDDPVRAPSRRARSGRSSSPAAAGRRRPARRAAPGRRPPGTPCRRRPPRSSSARSGAAAVVDEPAAAAPRRRRQRRGRVEHAGRARASRREQREAERAAGGARRRARSRRRRVSRLPLSATSCATVVLRPRVSARRVGLLELLGRRRGAGRRRQRRGERRERERRARGRGTASGARPGRARRRRRSASAASAASAEQREHPALGARGRARPAGRCARPFRRRRRRRRLPASSTDAPRSASRLKRVIARARFPITRQQPTSTAAGEQPRTIPSGHRPEPAERPAAADRRVLARSWT